MCKLTPLFLVLALSSPARAEGLVMDIDGGIDDTPAMSTSDTQRSEPCSPVVAALVAAGSTLTPVVPGIVMVATSEPAGLLLIASGMTFGPSVGHLLAGEFAHAVLMTLLRGGLVVGGGLMAGAGIFGGEGLFFGGLGMVGAAGVLAIYDLIDAPLAARRARRRHLAVAPLITRSEHHATYGVSLSGNF